jgi:hypothetical protein
MLNLANPKSRAPALTSRVMPSINPLRVTGGRLNVIGFVTALKLEALLLL